MFSLVFYVIIQDEKRACEMEKRQIANWNERENFEEKIKINLIIVDESKFVHYNCLCILATLLLIRPIEVLGLTWTMCSGDGKVSMVVEVWNLDIGAIFPFRNSRNSIICLFIHFFVFLIHLLVFSCLFVLPFFGIDTETRSKEIIGLYICSLLEVNIVTFSLM